MNQQTENSENKRWFAIKHKACGSMFTIEAATFYENAHRSDPTKLQCPNCGQVILTNKRLEEYANKINEYINAGEKEGISIQEICTNAGLECHISRLLSMRGNE